MNITTGVLSQYDANASQFIVNAGLTSVTQFNAVNTLVKSHKISGVWDKCHAIYLMVGGTATAHKLNLKDPRDLDAAYRLDFVGVWTHSSNGAAPGASTGYTYVPGTSGYANTFINALGVLNPADVHISYYSRTNSSPTDGRDMGVENSDGYCQMVIRRSSPSNQSLGLLGRNSPVTYVNTTNTNSTGFYQISRTSASSMKYFKNGSQLGSTMTTAMGTQTYPDCQMLLGSNNNGGTSTTPTPSTFPGRQIAYASIGLGLTDAQVTAHYNAVNIFNTALSRNV